MKKSRGVLVVFLLMAPILFSACAMRTKAVPPTEVKSAPQLPTIPEPDARAAQVPAGYRVEVVAKDLVYPTSVEFDERENMYIAESGYSYGDSAAPARVLKISPAGEIEVVASQLNGPVNDILWNDGRLYISHRGKISSLEADGGIRDLITGLPSLGDHHNNQLTAGRDGKIYFGQGTATNSGVVGLDSFMMGWLALHPDFHDTPAEDIRLKGKDFVTINPLMMAAAEKPPMVTTSGFQPFGKNAEKVQGAVKANGTILRMNPDGSGLEVYAWGLRNPYGVMWGPDGQLYVAENGFDERGSRPIANALENVWTIRQGAWYGWPDFSSGIPVTDPRFKPEYAPSPEFLMENHPPVEKPFLTLPSHAAVGKIDFASNDAFGGRGKMFLALFGDMNPMTGQVSEPHGYKVVTIDPSTHEVETFFRLKEESRGDGKFAYVATSGPKRPLDVRFSPRGDALYIVDFGAFAIVDAAAPVPTPFPGTGVVWRITRDAMTAGGPPANLSMKPGQAK